MAGYAQVPNQNAIELANALGICTNGYLHPEKGATNHAFSTGNLIGVPPGSCPSLSGWRIKCTISQGVALGYPVPDFQAEDLGFAHRFWICGKERTAVSYILIALAQSNYSRLPPTPPEEYD